MEVTQQTGTIYWTILERGYISDLSNTLQMLCNPFKYKQLKLAHQVFYLVVILAIRMCIVKETHILESLT